MYTGGSFATTVDFDPGPGTFNISSAGGSDIFVNELDAAGNFIATSATGGTGGDGILAMTLSAAGNIYATGNFNGTCDFDPVGTYTLASVGGQDAFVMKLNALGTGISEGTNVLNSFSIFPNPSKGEFTLQLKEKLNNGGEVIVTDIMGKEIFKQELNEAKEVKLSLETKGLYFVRLESEGKRIVKKIVVE
jgi:hypothetical protein